MKLAAVPLLPIQSPPVDPWQETSAILARIKDPVFPDRDFVTMMIPHHQGAIDMAKAILLYGKDEQLKRLAQEIIADQQNEVQLMQLWLSKHPDGADPTNALNK